MKDIREVAKKYSKLQQELNNSLQPVKELLNSVFSLQNLKNETFTIINAATIEDIDQLFDAIIKLDQIILKTDKAWKIVKNKTIFKEFFKYCYQSRYYSFSIKKCEKEECTICKSIWLSQEIFSQIYHFSDSISGKNNHYTSLNEVYTQRAKNVGVTIMCSGYTVDYSCSSLFNNAENLFGIAQSFSYSYSNRTISRISDKIESSNSEHREKNFKNLLLNNNESNNLQYSNSKTWEDIDELVELSDNKESNELIKLSDDKESNKLVEFSDDKENDNYLETKSLLNLELLDANKTTIKQLFEKVFINKDSNINILILATQYPLYTEYTQKGVKILTCGKSLKFTICIYKNKKK
ncbi:7101_t:CDS:2 [Scutellospora calospora]|uniref:7101_t:CDS:1 n=1 Tax=Scutellospora calospora TaxID=85575 RepID=A0ACA9K9U7_9GLOM|nr:7101_t:CDS:2 [Scutellospora calospora]